MSSLWQCLGHSLLVMQHSAYLHYLEEDIIQAGVMPKPRRPRRTAVEDRRGRTPWTPCICTPFSHASSPRLPCSSPLSPIPHPIPSHPIPPHPPQISKPPITHRLKPPLHHPHRPIELIKLILTWRQTGTQDPHRLDLLPQRLHLGLQRLVRLPERRM